MQSETPHRIHLRTILILSPLAIRGLRNVFFLSFSNKIVHAFFIWLMRAKTPVNFYISGKS